MKTFRIAVLPGDGIGVDVTQEALRVLRAVSSSMTGVALTFEEHSVGAGEYLRSGSPLPESAFHACETADAVLLGAMGLPSVRWPDGRELTPQIDLRERLDLFCGLRPIRLYHADDSPLKNYGPGEIDLLIVRENCEGLFAGRHRPRSTPTMPTQVDSVSDELRITRRGAERVCRAAFRQALQRRRKVTLVDKANVLPSMVFFREIFDEVAREFPACETERIYVDAAALFLVKQPERFDVLVTENMFGDILSDLAAGLAGGLGMAPSADLGDRCGVFQPVHGTAPDLAGKGIANPTATILSAAMMLEWLADVETILAGKRIRQAVETVFQNPALRTPDLHGTLKTSELTDAILQAL